MLMQVSRSLHNLSEVDYALGLALLVSAGKHDFAVTDGLRSLDRQRELVAAGRSWTVHSAHLVGRAVDIVAYRDGRVTWEPEFYRPIAQSVRQFAALITDRRVTWGGEWREVDACHFEIAERAQVSG